MSLLKRLMKSEAGFTLVEMTVVVAIISALAALALPAVTGVTTDTRATSKLADQRQVEQAVTRFEDKNGGDFPILGSTDPFKTVSGTAGVIKIAVNSNTIGGSGVLPSGVGVVTCGNGGISVLAAIEECFGNLDFITNDGTKLVPDFIKIPPQHFNEDVTHSDASPVFGDGDNATADLVIPNCNISGDTCEFYLEDTDNLTTTGLTVWAVDGLKTVFTFKLDEKYGTD